MTISGNVSAMVAQPEFIKGVIFDIDPLLAAAATSKRARRGAASRAGDHASHQADLTKMHADQLTVPGLTRLIRRLKDHGVRLAGATGVTRWPLNANLAELGSPGSLFDVVFEAQQVVRDEQIDSDAFQLVAKRLGLPPSACLVITDTPQAVRVAKQTGFRCLALTTHATRTGFKNTGADHVLADLSRIPKALNELLPSPANTSPATRQQATPRHQGSQGRAKRRGRAKRATSVAPLKILFVASECAPFAKTGGLGDVVAGLSKALTEAGHDVRIVMPLFGALDQSQYGITFDRSCCVHFGAGQEQWIGLHQGTLDNKVPVWFVDCDKYFGRTSLYGSPDDALRYGLLSKAALQVCKDKRFVPDVMHVHDWMTALAAVYLKTWDWILSPLSNTASVLTIHNIGYQGKFAAGFLPRLGVGWEHYTPLKFEDYGMINLLKAGIYFSDAITTVSPTHANEIREPVGGMGLAPFINDRGGDVCGILNGVDYEHWNPSTDPLIPARYSADNLSGKATCKTRLQQELGLENRPDLPLVGVVSRFAAQKGFDLLLDALPGIMNEMMMQFVILGSGDRRLEEQFATLASRYPGRIGVHIGYDVRLSHWVEAGSDFFVMPSLYEPCGLNQVYSLKYGTLPIVRATGGLDDTVENYDESTGSGTGFKFWAATPRALHDTIGWANATWWDRPDHIRLMQARGMAEVFSWSDAAAQYVDVYRHALGKRRRG